MDAGKMVRDALPFLTWLGDWKEDLPTVKLADEVDDPRTVAMFSVDVINGFCYKGPLSSPRVADIVPPIVRLFERAFELGVRNFILPQDTHQEDAVEFGSYPPHCTQSSAECETVPELKALPYFDEFVIMPKNSISSSIGTELPGWLEAHSQVNIFFVVGDCTDLCTYQLAMYLRLRANAMQRPADRVIVPVDCVDTYDLPVQTAQKIGAFPHHGDLLHLVFLYHMALNGIEVVARAE
jgi:nicotinamidase-related amidase